MYQEYFKLSRRPFNITPDPAFYYLTLPVRHSRDRIYAAIRQRAPVLLLSGAPGTGKTAFLKHLLVTDVDNIHWVFVDRAQLQADDLLMLIGDAFGIPARSAQCDGYAVQIRNRMTALEDEGVHPVIILDEADHLAEDTLEELLDWHASNRIQGASSTLILAGLPQLVHKIDDLGHVLFAPPWSDHFTLEPFDHQAMCTAIAHCLKIAGHETPPLFDSQALKSIYALSEGVPRVVNHICDLCLFCTANLGKRQVTMEVVEEVSRFILLDEDTSIQFGGDTVPLPRSAVSAMPVVSRSSMKFGPVMQWLRDGLLALPIIVGIWVFWLEESPLVTRTPSPQVDISNAQETGKEDAITALSSEAAQRMVITDIVKPKSPEEIHSIIDQGDDASRLTVDIEQTDKQALAADRHGPLLPDSNEYAGVSEVVGPVEMNQPTSKIKDEAARQERSAEVVIDSRIDLAVEKPVMNETDGRNESRSPTMPSHVEDGLVHTAPEHEEAIQSVQAEAESSISVSRVDETPVKATLNRALRDDAHLAAFEERSGGISVTKPEQRIGSRAVDRSTSDDLITAVAEGKRHEVQMLLDRGAAVDSVSNSGETALMKASWAGRLDIVELLISKTPQINRQSQEGWTALFYAAVRGHRDIVGVLLKNGAKVNLADLDGNTPLMAAAWNGHIQVAELLLIQGVDPDWKNRDGWSPLMFASLEGHIEIARLLIHHGADISLISHDGETSTELAAQQGHTQLVSLLARE
ncbi:MAG: ankyrin repeat domain-containing protein [Candidatus Thiodiazotropha sp.]